MPIRLQLRFALHAAAITLFSHIFSAHDAGAAEAPKDASKVVHISGKIVDENGQPVGGALLETFGPEIDRGNFTAGADGAFHFDWQEKPNYAALLFAKSD